MPRKGFTIIELLVVIVIIGVISAIVFVSYSGLNQKAVIASLESDLAINAKKLKLYQVEYSSFPTALDANNCPTSPQANLNYCLSFTSGNTLDYYNGDGPSFLLRLKNGSNVLKITQDSSPTLAVTVTNETINGTAFVINNPFLSNASWGADYDDEMWDEYRYEQTSTFNLATYNQGVISDARLSWTYASIYNGAGVCNKYLNFNLINLWTGPCNSNLSSFSGLALDNSMNSAKGGTFQINWKSDIGGINSNIWGYQSGMSNPRITFTWTRNN